LKKNLVIIFLILITSCKREKRVEIQGTPIAKVGDILITREAIEKGFPQFAFQLMGEEGKKEVVNYIVDLTLFYLAAKEEKIHQEPIVTEKLKWAERIVLAEEFFTRKIENVFVSQEEVDSFYKKYENDFSREVEFIYFITKTASDIEEIRNKIRKRVFSPALVSNILSQHKDVIGDVMSVNMGYLHMESNDIFSREIAKVLLTLLPGVTSDIISLSNPPGYAVIKILSISPTKQSKDVILRDIREYLRFKKISSIRDSLKNVLKNRFPVKIYGGLK
jgi:parvulin-like peptidyl-prolyl isomerase